jgi:hypothetical protein
MVFFFTGDHPLTSYINNKCGMFPFLDISGGNVTYACLSLAEKFCAENIFVYGADFSYPQGKCYARGTYFYPVFERKQNRLAPIEAGLSSFLYQSHLLSLVKDEKKIWYETEKLNFYKNNFMMKAASLKARVTLVSSFAETVEVGAKANNDIFTEHYAASKNDINSSEVKSQKLNPIDFLHEYKKDIANLPSFTNAVNLQNFNSSQKQIFMTLIPSIAALKRRKPETSTYEIFEKVKHDCQKEIEQILTARHN